MTLHFSTIKHSPSRPWGCNHNKKRCAGHNGQVCDGASWLAVAVRESSGLMNVHNKQPSYQIYLLAVHTGHYVVQKATNKEQQTYLPWKVQWYLPWQVQW